jgi:hypothetical protein
MVEDRPVTLDATIHPDTGYTKLGGTSIAYQIAGRGPPDLVLTFISSSPRSR